MEEESFKTLSRQRDPNTKHDHTFCSSTMRTSSLRRLAASVLCFIVSMKASSSSLPAAVASAAVCLRSAPPPTAPARMRPQ